MPIRSPQSSYHVPVAFWLFFVALMVAAMALIGAITRLTESGLSMVEWRPLIGALPPLNKTEWQRVFALYQTSPEFQLKNSHMTLDEFKTIFFWEWFHRLWGRLIGLVYALGLLVVWLKYRLPRGLKLRLIGLLILGGLQGVMGWVMVMSGLVDRPSVSHYRLAAHLGLAFLIFSLLLAQGLSLLKDNGRLHAIPLPKQLRRGLTALLALFGVTMVWGAFTAGLDAGLLYNEFPYMGNTLIPDEFAKTSQPFWIDIFEERAAIQFIHRWLALLTTTVTLAYALVLYRYSKRLSVLLAIVVLLQATLGVLTLLSGVNISLAVLHQAGALALLGAAVAITVLGIPYVQREA